MKNLRMPVTYGLFRALVAFALLQWVFGTPLVKSIPAAVLFGIVCAIGVWAQRGREPAPDGAPLPSGARSPLV